MPSMNAAEVALTLTAGKPINLHHLPHVVRLLEGLSKNSGLLNLIDWVNVANPDADEWHPCFKTGRLRGLAAEEMFYLYVPRRDPEAPKEHIVSVHNQITTVVLQGVLKGTLHNNGAVVVEPPKELNRGVLDWEILPPQHSLALSPDSAGAIYAMLGSPYSDSPITPYSRRKQS